MIKKMKEPTEDLNKHELGKAKSVLVVISRKTAPADVCATSDGASSLDC